MSIIVYGKGYPMRTQSEPIMSRSALDEAMSREVEQDGGTVTGVDVARFGSDRQRSIKRKGLQMVDMKILTKQDTQEVARQAKDFK